MSYYYNLPFKKQTEKEKSIGYIAAEEALEKFQKKALEALKEANI
jgi:hypothetical protein